jgi:predicted nucleic acid-binding protein
VKFVLDTNVFVDAFRDETFAEALTAFLEQALLTTFLSAVVVQELAAGARTGEQVRALESSIFRPCGGLSHTIDPQRLKRRRWRPLV